MLVRGHRLLWDCIDLHSLFCCPCDVILSQNLHLHFYRKFCYCAFKLFFTTTPLNVSEYNILNIVTFFNQRSLSLQNTQAEKGRVRVPRPSFPFPESWKTRGCLFFFFFQKVIFAVFETPAEEKLGVGRRFSIAINMPL